LNGAIISSKDNKLVIFTIVIKGVSKNIYLLRIPIVAQYITPIPISSISLSKLVQNPEGFVIK